VSLRRRCPSRRNVSIFARTSPSPNGNYSAPRNIKVRSAPAAWAPGSPVLACRRRAQWRRGWSSIGRRLEGPAAKWRSTYACRRPTTWSGRRARRSEACTGYTSLPPPHRVQSRYNKMSPQRDVTRLAGRVLPPRELRYICAARRRQKTDARDRY